MRHFTVFTINLVAFSQSAVVARAIFEMLCFHAFLCFV